MRRLIVRAVATAAFLAPIALPSAAQAEPIRLNSGEVAAPRENHRIMVGDFLGSDALDLLEGERYSRGLLIEAQVGTGSGDFTTWDLSSLAFRPEAAGDVNGDGADDLVWVGESGAVAGLNINRSGFDAPRPIPADLRGAAGSLADVDGDGDVDALGATDGSFRIAINDGSGVFTAQPVVAMSAQRPSDPVTGDFDGDGNLDAAVCSSATSSGTAVVLIGDGSGGFAPSAVTLSRPCEQIAAGDLDGDGAADLITNRFEVLFGQAGGPTAGAPIPSTAASSSSVAIADMDDDGNLDAIFGTSGVEIWRGDGAGAFTPVRRIGPQRQTGPLEAVSLAGSGERRDLIGDSGGVDTVWANVSSGPDLPQTYNRGPLFETTNDPLPSFDSDDPSAGLECSTGFGYAPCSDALWRSLYDGVFVVRARAVSDAGVDPTPARWIVEVDTAAPTITLGRPEGGRYPTFDVRSSEPVTSLRAEIGRDVSIPLIRDERNRTVLRTRRLVAQFGEGRSTWTATLVALDAAGNETTVRQVFRVGKPR